MKSTKLFKKMKNVIAFGASTSKQSINKKLAKYASELLENVSVIPMNLNDYEIPLFSVDLEMEMGFPESVRELNDFLDSTDGYIISLAEHNGAYAAAFKNTFDWLSRIERKVWRNKPILLLSTSPGNRGGKSVLEMAMNRFPYHGGNIIGSMSLPSFNENFKNGKIVNKIFNKQLKELVSRFEKSL